MICKNGKSPASNRVSQRPQTPDRLENLEELSVDEIHKALKDPRIRSALLEDRKARLIHRKRS